MATGNHRKVRILFIVPDLKREGAQTQLVELINGLPDTEFNKYLFTLESRLDQIDRLDLESVQHVNMVRRFRLDLPRIARRIARLVDSEEIDIIHCTLQFAILFGWAGRALSRRKPKLVAALHTTQNRNLKEELQDRLVYSPILRTCDRVIFVSEKQRETWERKFPHLIGNTVAIHNGVDVSRFSIEAVGDEGSEVRRSLGVGGESLVVASLAAFRPEKGHRHLIDAFGELTDNTHLLLAGEGPLLESIKEYAGGKPYGERIHFLGNVADVRGVIAAADVTVLASTAVETFSIAMLESMAMGVPVVATRLGGMEEAVLPGQTGALAEPGNSRSLAEALKSVLSPPWRHAELGELAKEMVQRQFSKEGMIKKSAQELRSMKSSNGGVFRQSAPSSGLDE